MFLSRGRRGEGLCESAIPKYKFDYSDKVLKTLRLFWSFFGHLAERFRHLVES